jgi:hypothetical protein
MAKTLDMVFRNAAGKDSVISLAEPIDGLTLAAVNTVMQDIIAKNIFTTKSGDLVQVVEARIRSNDKTVLA